MSAGQVPRSGAWPVEARHLPEGESPHAPERHHKTWRRVRPRASAIPTEADRRRAVLAAGRATALVAAALPGTHTLIFGYVKDGTWFGTLEAVRAPGGALL